MEGSWKKFWKRPIDWKTGVAWLGPLAAFLIIIEARFIYAASFPGGVVLALFIGMLVGTVGIVAIAIVLVKYRLMQILMFLLTTVLFAVVLLFWVASRGQGFNLMLVTTGYTESWNVTIIASMIQTITKRESFWRPRLAFQHRKAITTAVALACIVACPLLVTTPWYASLNPVRFTITDAQAMDYDLVLYYPDPPWINASVCQIAADHNVTLSFNVVQPDFAAAEPRSTIIANAVRICNIYNVSVEVWPLFAWDNGSYPSLSDADRIPGLYADFRAWAVRESINISYIMWDMEAGGEVDTCTNPAWVDDLGIFGYTGKSVYCLATTRDTWNAAVATIRSVHQQAKADGYSVRATTHASMVYDMFDGDDSIQRNWRLPVWTTGEYEYVSQMLYRGCDGPGNRSNAFIYEGVRASALAVPGKTAVCLGCINYEPYPDIPSVVADVRLALAAGADSVRLFQGCSWVFGTGNATSDLDDLGWTNPPKGLAGLDALLAACRQGGNVTYRPEQNDRKEMIVSILLDVFQDFVFP